MFRLTSTHFKWLWLFLATCLITACGGGGGGNSDDGKLKDEGIIDVENPVIDEQPLEVSDSVPLISAVDWDETAVRQVLQVFAFSGFAGDEQIKTWADMAPQAAIVQMISFNTTNAYLSPAESTDQLDTVNGSLLGLSELWSSSSSRNAYSSDYRSRFEKDDYNSPEDVWLAAINKRGLNPVRQRVGLLETNYHMVANLDANVNNRQMYAYYDEIMDNLSTDTPYQKVLAEASTSAAIAMQYNHKDNKFIDAKFQGNEDFGREFHQLFFNILGTEDSQYHELTTVRNTAKALTDMQVERVTEGDKTFWADEVTMGTEFHFPSALEILNETFSGDTAEAKLNALASHAIENAESLDNLPILLVRQIADDTISEENIAIIQTIWASMETKDLLQFYRTYAISEAFHSPSRTKYWSSIERNILLSNQMTLTNQESYLNYYSPTTYLRNEGIALFRPMHNVFGHQTGVEASSEPNVFKENYNRAVDRHWFITRYSESGDNWEKDWASIIPSDAEGNYRVIDVGEWLWTRFIADDLTNFGTLERAHVFALLGSGTDFGYFVDEADPEAVYSVEQIETDIRINELYRDMQLAKMNLSSEDSDKRKTANYRVGLAINFISALPYAFAQEGL